MVRGAVGLNVPVIVEDPNIDYVECDAEAGWIHYKTPVETTRPCRCWVGPGANDYKDMEETVMVRRLPITRGQFETDYADALSRYDAEKERLGDAI